MGTVLPKFKSNKQSTEDNFKKRRVRRQSNGTDKQYGMVGTSEQLATQRKVRKGAPGKWIEQNGGTIAA